MKLKRLLVAALSVMMTLSIGTAVFFASAENTTEPLYQIYYKEDGSFAGINAKASMSGAVWLGVKKDMTEMNNIFLMQTISFETPIDTAESTGLFIKLKSPDRNLGFRFIMQDTDGNYWRTYNGSKNGRNDPFVSEDGKIGSLQMLSGQHKFTKTLGTGTWYIPWTGAKDYAKATTVLPSGTKIQSVSFGLVLTNAGWWGGDGVADGTFVGINDKTSLNGAIYTGLKKDMAEQANAFSLMTITFETPVDSVQTAGIFIRMSGARTNYGFTFLLEDESGSYYNAYKNGVGKDCFVYADGTSVSLTDKDNQHVFKGEGTWFIPWNAVSNADGTGTAMADGTKIKAVSFGMVLTKKDWYAGYGVSIGRVGTIKVNAPGDAVAEILVDPTALTVTSDAEDTTADGRSDPFVYENGEYNYIEVNSGKWAHLFEKGGTTGTMFYPWNGLVSAKKGAPIPEGTKIVKWMFGIDMRSHTWESSGIVIGTFATVKVEESGVTVKKLFDTAEMTYAANADDETADINLYDIEKGLVVAPYASVSGGFSVNSPETDTPITVQNWVFSRKSYDITVRYLNEKGRELGAATSVSCNFEDGQYTITPPSFMGYTYQSADYPLTGNATDDMTITLSYAPTEYTITLKFMDCDENEIADERTIKVKYNDIYTIEETEIQIDGYTFIESSRRLQGTVMGDMTITLTYEKQSGCGSTVTTDSLLLCLTAAVGLTAVAVLYRKRKETNVD